MDDTLQIDVAQTFKCKLKDNSAIHKFLYSAKKDSPLFATKKTDEFNEKLKLLSRASHDAKRWYQLYLECKENKEWETRISLWMLIQHQTVSLITNKYNFPTNIRKELEHCIGYSEKNKPQKINKNSKRLYVNKMEIGTENMDCIVAGIKLKKAGYNPVILNLANQESPAAAKGKGSEGGTQEENLFKRSTYYLSLWPNKNKNKQHTPSYGYDDIWKNEEKESKENTDENSDKKRKKNKKKNKKKKGKGSKEVYMYPMHDKYGGIYSKNVYVFRGSESSGYAMLPLDQRCVLSFIAVAARVHYSMGPLTKNEIEAYKNKIQTIYRIAYENGHDALVLGALGCGIFNNPPGDVAKIFYDVLMEEFNGCFARVTFAILWDHNSKPLLRESFMKYFPQNEKLFESL